MDQNEPLDVSEEPSQSKPLVVVFLAAGFGSRIRKDLDADPQFRHLRDTPKPLLPLAGLPILSHWLPCLSTIPNLTNIFLITNAAHKSFYDAWLSDLSESQLAKNLPSISIISNDSIDNDTRMGAVHDLNEVLKLAAQVAPSARALIIAGDTLLPGIQLSLSLSAFFSTADSLAVFSYRLKDMADSVRRGMLAIEKKTPTTIYATALVEKPKTPALAPSQWATAPVYVFSSEIWPLVTEFLQENASKPLEQRDAPGFLLSWLIPRHPCRLLPVQSRIDIGRLSHYKDALVQYSTSPFPRPRRRTSNEPAIGRAYPRIGLLGNPSDMYNGRVVAIAISSEGFAEVVATPSNTFHITANDKHELPTHFRSIADFVNSVQSYGVHYGARRLVFAAALAFVRKYAQQRKGDSAGGSDIVAELPTCQLSYSTTIPERVGLSGSSALILATWRALARFFNTSLEEIDHDQTIWPVLLRSVERDDLGISCGLMDRVAQVLQGCVEMDFSDGEPGTWSHLPEEAVPQLYIAFYNDSVGECSGVVHGRAKKRAKMENESVQSIAAKLAKGAETGANVLRRKAEDGSADVSVLAHLFRKNFELRCALFGKEAVGSSNVGLALAAEEAGFAAKMTGSGGCAVCIPNPVRTLSEEEEDRAKEFFSDRDIVFRKVQILKRLEWRP